MIIIILDGIIIKQSKQINHPIHIFSMFRHILTVFHLHPNPLHFLPQGFSTFKTRFSKLQSMNHQKVSTLYQDLIKFQDSLQYIQKIKYRKAIQLLGRKLNRIIKRCSERQSDIDSPRQFNTRISYEFLYGLQNQKYKPIGKEMVMNHVELGQLYKVTCGLNSKLEGDLDIAYREIMSNPKVNESLYQKIRQRCQYFEEQLCMSIYEGYCQMVKAKQQSINLNTHNALRKLKGVNKSQEVFSKDFKFGLKGELQRKDNYCASEIGKILCKFGYSSQKTMMLALKSLSNEGYKILTPLSLANHLLILGYHKVQIPQINSKLFELFDHILQQPVDKLQFLGENGPINSFLFYVLCNQIQMDEFIKLCVLKLKQNYMMYMKKNQYTSQILKKKIHDICSWDKEVFWIMITLLRKKYKGVLDQIDFNENSIPLNIVCDEIEKMLPSIASNSYQDFERYLEKKRYTYQKSVFQSQTQNTKQSASVSPDILYTIEDKNFLCLNLPKWNQITKKCNGVGEMILEFYHLMEKNVKVINPIVVGQCEKWVNKQEYFKSKLKGIVQPLPVRKKIFDQ